MLSCVVAAVFVNLAAVSVADAERLAVAIIDIFLTAFFQMNPVPLHFFLHLLTITVSYFGI